MVLILSNSVDLSTSEVVNWLLFNKVNFIRINDTATISVDSCSMQNNNNCLKLSYSPKESEIKKIDLNSIKSFWYRRGKLNFGTVIESDSVNFWSKRFIEYKNNEDLYLLRFIYNFISNKCPCINSIFDNDQPKMTNLLIAQKVGLSIPDTILTDQKDEMLLFIKKHKQSGIITKALEYGGFNIDENHQISGYTCAVTDISNKKEYHYSFFQEMLNKSYELRIFYLNGIFHATAIFSQLDTKTSTDFRNYNYKKPNRTPPYKLPSEIKEKLHKFMVSININCGSIDMVVTKDKRYVFLEVNPIGQFKQVSYPGNFFLEKNIANVLMY